MSPPKPTPSLAGTSLRVKSKPPIQNSRRKPALLSAGQPQGQAAHTRPRCFQRFGWTKQYATLRYVEQAVPVLLEVRVAHMVELLPRGS